MTQCFLLVPKASHPYFLLFCYFITVLALSIFIGLTSFSVRIKHTRTPLFLHSSSNESLLIKRERNHISRAIVMSCPIFQPQNHRGNWKPRRMSRGVETVIHQIIATKSTLPLLFGYFKEEKEKSYPWCRRLSEKYLGQVRIFCYEIPEAFPKNMYGYPKIFAIRHAAVNEAIWIDCDVFPVRPLDALFEDDNYKRTGAMFWPDSRDYFDETKLAPMLRLSFLQKSFSLKAWWVRQGFDSGVVLLNRKLCSEELASLCMMARSPEMERIRALSMGDKDLFHIVWILHGRNATLVPYIGESGNIQADILSKKWEAMKEDKLSTWLGPAHWKMSSQVKFGRDGNIYALHQLHRQPSFTLIATLSKDALFHRPESNRTRYVIPTVVTKKDLRIEGRIRERRNAAQDGDLVRSIERALTHRVRNLRVPGLLGEGEGEEKGMEIWRAPGWVVEAAADMDRQWAGGLEGRELLMSRRRKRRNRGRGRIAGEVERRLRRQDMEVQGTR